MIEPKTKKALLAIVLVLWLATMPALQAIYHNPGYHGELAQWNPNVREGGTLAIMAMLGGFRNVAANMLWLQSDKYWHQGGRGWWKMLPLLRTITQLDPHFVAAWDTLSWHCAWNLHSEASEADKPKWIQAGVDVLREGIKNNPDKYDLYSSLAWLYHERVKDYNRAVPIWQKVLTFKDAPVTQGHMLAHAYENTWQIDKAIEVWRWCVRRKSDDMVARRALKWLTAHKNDRAYLITLWERDNKVRKSRGLPAMPRPDQVKDKP